MHSFVLQDFITIRGATSVPTISQSESAWLDLDGYQDVVAYIDIRELNDGGGSGVAFNLQTAPIKDEYLFVNMETTPLSATAAFTAPKPRVITLAQLSLATSPINVPLARFMRWQLNAAGSLTGVWDATFRIIVCANCVGAAGGMHRAMYHGR